MAKAMKIVLLGAPGVGKGTYGKMLSKDLSLPIFTMGDYVRNEIKSKSALGQKMASYSHRGELVPDELIMKVAKDTLTNPPFNKGAILDGFPRTVLQAEAMQSFYPLDFVINLEMKDEYLIQKLLGRRMCPSQTCGKAFNVANVHNAAEGVDMPPLMPSHGNPEECECGTKLITRKDDNEEVITFRLQEYKDKTLPLVNFFSAQGILKTQEIKKGIKDYPKVLALLDSKSTGAHL